MLLPSKTGVSYSWVSAAREQKDRPFSSAANGFILQLWEDQNHLFLMPSTVALLPHLCPSPTPVAPEGGKSALNNAFPHFLDPLSCPMASCPHLSSSTFPPVLGYNHTTVLKYPQTPPGLYSASQSTSSSSNWDSSHCLLLWQSSFPKPLRCSHLLSHQKHWTQRANIGGNAFLKKTKSHALMSIRIPLKDKKVESFISNFETAWLWTMSNLCFLLFLILIMYFLVIAINYVHCRHTMCLPALQVHRVSHNISLCVCNVGSDEG